MVQFPFMAKNFSDTYGPWAIVTGASSGIGMEFATILAGRGLNCVLVARRQDNLQKLAAELANAHGVQTKVVALDLGQDDAAVVLDRATEELDVGLLINNAGFGHSGMFLDLELDQQIECVDVNLRTPVALTYLFGRRFRARGRGGIILVGSTVSFLPVPGLSIYAGTKSFHTFFGQSIRHEMKQHNIDVQVLCPGTTRTGFQEVSGTRNFLAMSPRTVAEISIRKLGRQTVVVTGIVNKAVAFLTRIAPRSIATSLSAFVMRMMRVKALPRT